MWIDWIIGVCIIVFGGWYFYNTIKKPFKVGGFKDLWNFKEAYAGIGFIILGVLIIYANLISNLNLF